MNNHVSRNAFSRSKIFITGIMHAIRKSTSLENLYEYSTILHSTKFCKYFAFDEKLLEGYFE